MKRWTGIAIAVALLASLTAAAGAAGAPQDAVTVSGQVIDAAGKRGLADVAVTFVGPMEGQAERALASFPLMAEEIADKLAIPRIRAVTDAEGRFRFDTRTHGLYALVFRRQGHLGAAKPGDPLTSPLVTSTVTVSDGPPPAAVVIEMIARN